MRLFLCVLLAALLLSPIALAAKNNKNSNKNNTKAPKPFAQVDSDKSGSVSVQEYTAGKVGSEADFKAKDKNGDGQLSTGEYYSTPNKAQGSGDKKKKKK